MQNIIVIAALITCLKVLIAFKTGCEHLDLVWVLWTLDLINVKMVLKLALLFTGILWRKRKKCPFSLSWHWGSVSGIFFFLLPSSLLYFPLCNMTTFKILNIIVISALHSIWSLGKVGMLEIGHPLKPRGRTWVKLFLPILAESWWHSCAIKTCPKGLTGKGAIKQSRLWDFEWANSCACLELLDQSVTIAHGRKNFEG